jgi:hypothetical protein
MFKRAIPTVILLAAGSMGAEAADSGAHGFLEDSKATLSMRTLYFNSDNRDGAAEPSCAMSPGLPRAPSVSAWTPRRCSA